MLKTVNILIQIAVFTQNTETTFTPEFFKRTLLYLNLDIFSIANRSLVKSNRIANSVDPNEMAVFAKVSVLFCSDELLTHYHTGTKICKQNPCVPLAYVSNEWVLKRV